MPGILAIRSHHDPPYASGHLQSLDGALKHLTAHELAQLAPVPSVGLRGGAPGSLQSQSLVRIIIVGLEPTFPALLGVLPQTI